MAPDSYPLWDLPTRVFHWLIVACLPLSWWSAETGNYELHQWLGYTVIALVLGRIVWGFAGSPHSRFADFLVGPRRVLAYLRGQAPASVGHNPLGGWSVVALLTLLLLQAFSGLFNTDDVFFNGPLYHAASVSFRDSMGVLHEVVFYSLLALVALHIAAVLYHQLWRRESLLQAMLRGSASGREGRAPPVPGWRAVAIMATVALALWAALQLVPPPPSLMW